MLTTTLILTQNMNCVFCTPIYIYDPKYFQSIGIKNDIVTIANWDSTGSDSGFNSGVASTTFNFEAPLNDIYNQYKLFTKVVVAAYHQYRSDAGHWFGFIPHLRQNHC